MPEIQVHEINLYYELHGQEGQPVLVLNNGIIMNAATSWIFQTRPLSAHYRVLQYDCRGQGQSDHPPGPYTMEMHADDLAGLLEALALEQAHIAGISYGGEVAQAFALKYPEQTNSLILIDTVSEVGPELKIIIQSWMDALRTEDPLHFFHATVPWNFSSSFIRENPDLLEDAKKRYAALDFQAIRELIKSFLDVDFTDRLGEITAPTCLMVGEKDHLKGIEYAQMMKRHLPQAELHVLPGAGHASCWENPEVFNSVILGFLSKQP